MRTQISNRPAWFRRHVSMVVAGVALAACTTLETAPPTLIASPIADDPFSVDADFPPSIEELNFESHGDRLNGIAYLANGEGPHPTVILLHGYPGNEKNLDVAQALRRDGFNVLFFHYRGAWGSEGEFSFTHVIEDVASAADFLRANAETYRVDTGSIILIGHSMGGFAALQGAARDRDIRCVAGLAPADFGAIGQAPAEALAGFAAYSDSMQMLAGWTGEKAVAELNTNTESFSLTGIARDLDGKSVLLIAGDKDQSVPPAMVDAVAAAYAEMPELDLTHITLSGDHSFSWSRIEFTETILDWIHTCR